MSFNKKEIFQNNLDAISIAYTFLISKESKINPHVNSLQSIEAIDKYKGFGGIKEVLLNDDPVQWNKSSMNLYELRKQLEVLCSQFDDLYKEKPGTFYQSIKNSVLSSFYTPKSITQSIVNPILSNFKPQSILEPSAGVGAFINAINDSDKNNQPEVTITAVEKDEITSVLLQVKAELQGKNVVVHRGAFEEFCSLPILRNKNFDLVIGNPPFGDIKVFDPEYVKDKRPIIRSSTNRIHNYFFIKNLDKLNDNGVLAFIITSSFLNTPGNEAIRKYIFSKADLISLTRLPNKLFAEEAGTEVSSDMIILKKNVSKTSLTPFEQKLTESVADHKYGNINKAFDFYTNNSLYLADRISFDTDLYGKPAALLDYDNSVDHLAKELNLKIENDILHYLASKKNLSLDLFESDEESTAVKINQKEKQIQFNLFDELIAPSTTKVIHFADPVKDWYTEGTLIYYNSTVGNLQLNKQDPANFDFVPINLKLNSINVLQTQDYITVRNLFNDLSIYEKENGRANEKLREDLNKAYDHFEKKYGKLNERKNKALINFDRHSSQSFAIEKRTIDPEGNFIFTKSDLFEKPIAFASTEATNTNPIDALYLSINKFNAVNIEFIKKRSGISDEKELLKALDHHIYFDFIHSRYEYKDAFLIGDIVEKLRFYEQNFSSNQLNSIHLPEGKSYQALRSVLPLQISFDQLDFNLGERWIPIEYFENFASNLFQTAIDIQYTKSTDSYHCDVSSGSLNSMILDVFSVKTQRFTYNGINLLEYALVNTNPYVTKTIVSMGQELKVPDHEAMRNIALKIEDISNKFSDYMHSLEDKDRKTIEEIYNKKFNSYSTYKSNGDHLTFSGLEHFETREHQRDAVWKLILNGGGVGDHAVGAGKSLVMACLSQKMKEIGFAKKPMIICLKSNAKDVAKDYLKAFPKANILYPSENDFKKGNRASYLNMIKNNDWDCIILSHEQFGMIPQPLDIQEELLNRELYQLEEDLQELSQQGTKISRRLIKGLEKRKVSLDVRLKTILATIRKDDDVPDFRELGIDHLSVDESHEFKNLAFTTRHTRVAGIGNTEGSKRSFNMLVACRTIQQIHKADKGISFFSGTTLSNSLTELYNIFKYLTPSELEKQNIYNFDSWASVFTKKSTEFELSITNQLIMKERFRTFIKVPELCSLYNKVTHYIGSRDLKVKRPEKEVILVNIPLTSDQLDFNNNLIRFAETGDASLIGRPMLSESEKNAKMLIATNTARKMAVDLRLVDPAYSDDDGNKLSVCAKNIHQWYQESNQYKGTQLVFSDLGTPKTDGSFNVYDELKRKLIEDYKIPEKEIAFIHDASTDMARMKLFQKVNDGEVRIMMGSTKKMGTGVNVQKRIVAMHHLNIPWTPKDLEQRDGRGERQGNEIAEYFDNKVRSYVYAVEKSLDAYSFNLITNKQNFIDQVKRNSIGARTFDEGSMDENSGMNFKEYVAVLSGNTDLLDKLKIDQKIAGLESEFKSFKMSQQKISVNLKNTNTELVKVERILSSLESDHKHYLSSLKMDESGAKLNPIELFGIKSNDPQELGNHLLSTFNTNTSSDPKLIGNLYGFDLFVQKKSENVGNVLFAKRGIVEYSQSNGVPNSNPSLAIRYFINSIDRVKDFLPQSQAKREKLIKDIRILSDQCNNAWNKLDLLTELKNESSVIEKRIVSGLDPLKKETSEKPKPSINKIKI